jgi:hypothetical protein
VQLLEFLKQPFASPQLLRRGDIFFEQRPDFCGDGTAAGSGSSAKRIIEIVGDVFNV